MASLFSKRSQVPELSTVRFDSNFGAGERALLTAILEEHYQRIFEQPMPAKVDIPAQRWEFSKEPSGCVTGQTDDKRMHVRGDTFRHFVEKFRGHCRTPTNWEEPSTQLIPPAPRVAAPFSLSRLFFSSPRAIADSYVKGTEQRPQ